MRYLPLLAFLATAAAATGAQSPFVANQPGAAINPQSTAFSGPGTAPPVVDDFETYIVAVGNAEVIGSDMLDDLTITGTGQGPGLVADGCTYSAGAGGALQWNGDAWFGTTTKSFLSDTASTLTLFYDSPQGDISFDLDAYSGFADTATVSGYDAGGILVFSNPPINLPGGFPVNFAYLGAAVSEVRIVGSAFSWSPIIDNHAYRGGGLTLAINGPCPGPATVTLAGAAPFAGVAFANGPGGSFTIPGGPCAGTSLGISGPTLLGIFSADAAGSISLAVTLPAGFCGSTLQAVDISSCTASNAVVL